MNYFPLNDYDWWIHPNKYLPKTTPSDFGSVSDLLNRMFTGGTATVTADQVTDQPDAVVYTFDVPGFKKSDLKVELQGSTLHVSGIVANRSVTRAVYLGNFDPTKIEATCEDGVLTIRVGKRIPQTQKTLEIKIT